MIGETGNFCSYGAKIMIYRTTYIHSVFITHKENKNLQRYGICIKTKRPIQYTLADCIGIF